MMTRTLTAASISFQRYLDVRRTSEALCESLHPEDCVIQSMPLASPIRWHLAHTTWFFETFVLAQAIPDYEPFEPAFEFLFNSYYNAVGEQFPQDRRGLLSRPTLSEVFDYRRHVDDEMERLLAGDLSEAAETLMPVIETGLHHEQQHQELMLTDVKHLFFQNPIYPVFREVPLDRPQPVASLTWSEQPERLAEIGCGEEGFTFDNERPRHRVFVEAHRLASRPITNGEFLEFLQDGGYRRPEFWLSEGWKTAVAEDWNSPLYWVRRGEQWWQFTLSGLRPLKAAEPVCHVSYFEADAFARWRGARLPREAEWELAAAEVPVAGNFFESERFHPRPLDPEPEQQQPQQLFGDLWEWTSSSYAAYPGYRPASGALGEYNGKFMCNQYVLRGGSCATPQSHIRPTYRNFFPPGARWQFSGIRLAE